MTAKNPFDYQGATTEQVAHVEAVRQVCRLLLGAIERHVPVGRERSLAITKLEEASMWAVKGIVMEDTDAEKPG